VISGPPHNILKHLDNLRDIITKLVPENIVPEEENRSIEISDREVIEVDKDEGRPVLSDTAISNIVDGIADLSVKSEKLKSPSGNAGCGITEIKKALPDFRPEDAGHLLEEMTQEATQEFTSDITRYVISKRKNELKALPQH
jgi:hypothetical protein